MERRAEKLVLLLPGSREREVAKIWPIMAKVVDLMPDDVQFVAAAVNEQTAAMMMNHPRVKVEVGKAQELMQRAALAITASGTATMECAFYGCPMIVVYKVNWLTYLVGRMVVKVNWLAMPNVIAGPRNRPRVHPAQSKAAKHCSSGTRPSGKLGEEGVDEARVGNHDHEAWRARRKREGRQIDIG